MYADDMATTIKVMFDLENLRFILVFRAIIDTKNTNLI